MPNTTSKIDSLNKLTSLLSVKNFITDIPRLINNAFGTIVNCILDFYNPDSKTINVNRINSTYVNATTVTATNLIIGTANGKVNYADIAQRLNAIETRLNLIRAISKDEINDIYDYEG